MAAENFQRRAGVPVETSQHALQEELQTPASDPRVTVRSAESRPAMVPLYECDRYRCRINLGTHPTCVLAPHHQPTTHPRAMERQTEHEVPDDCMMVYGPDRWIPRSREWARYMHSLPGEFRAAR